MPAVLCPACGTVAERTAAGACAWCGGCVADETLTRAPADPNAPTLDAGPRMAPDPRRWSIPGYEILGELGRGGMGVVYRAHEVGLDREVALKVLLSGTHAGPTERARFRAEAEAAAALRHPHTVQVFRVGEHQGLPFLALELVAGGTLADRLKAGPMPVADAAALIEKAARAVALAHAAGIAHRDLKPANILLTADGEPKVADFGLVRREDSELTASGAVMGTPAYMAPEQARGDTKSVGPAADVWALGAVLYECLTGRPPFLADTPADTIHNVLDRDPLAVRRVRPEVAKDLQAVCLKCLEKDPRRRYASAGALADDLARYQRGEPVTARRPPVWARMARRVARYKVPAAVAAAVLLAATGTAFLLTVKDLRPLAPAAGLPADLAAIPPDAAGFLSVRPSDVWAHPIVGALARDLFGAGGDGPPEPAELDKSLHEMTGVRVADIERVTLVFPNDPLFGGEKPGTYPLLLVRTNQPVDLTKVRTALETVFGAFDRKDHRDRWYLEAPGFALFAITDRDVAFGSAEDVRNIIDRVADGPGDGPLTRAIEAAAGTHSAVVALRPTVIRPDRLNEAVPDAGGEKPAAARSILLFQSLTAARLAVATLDIHPPAADNPLPGLDLAARFDFDAEPAAAAAVPAVRHLLARAAAARPGPNPAPWAAVLLPELRTAVAETTVRQTGAAVEIDYRPRWTAAKVAAVRRAATAAEAEHAEYERFQKIGLALHTSADTNGHLPEPVVRDKAGKPLRSWRVEVLPFLEQERLYRRLKLDEPWDSPHNKPLLADIPAVFADPGSKGPFTRVQAVVGPGTLLGSPNPLTLGAVPDGLSGTLFVVEAADPVHWAEPKDYAFEPGKVLRLGRPEAKTFHAVLGDGYVRILPKTLTPAVFEAAATRAGGEIIDWDRLTVSPMQKAKR